MKYLYLDDIVAPTTRPYDVSHSTLSVLFGYGDNHRETIKMPII